jgi:pimeloyl-ACP methyl ester carboxylesterase
MREHALIEKDVSLFYKISGKGDTVILLHGFGEDGSVWDHYVPELKKNYTLLIPDLAGSGNSTANMEGITIDTLADHVNMILVKEDVRSCYMIGHSMGGYVALAFAEKYSDKLLGLGLFHSTAFADDEEKKANRLKNIEFIRKHGAAKFITQTMPNLFSEEYKNEHPEVVQDIIEKYSSFSPTSLVAYTEAMMTRPDRTHVLKEFGKPVLLIIGEKDNAVPLEQSLRLCKIADFAYIYIGTHSGHMGMLEEPEFCLKAIQDFLSGK